jgi:hypothetical protein
MTYRDDAAADDPLSKVARSLLESAQRIAQIDDEAPQAPNNSDHGERATFESGSSAAASSR